MTGAMELPLVRRRLPAFSERAWSPDGVSDVNDFKRRMNITDSLFEALTFPVKDISTGFVKDESLEADGVFSCAMSIMPSSGAPNSSGMAFLMAAVCPGPSSSGMRMIPRAEA